MNSAFIQRFKLSPYAKCWAAIKRTNGRGTQVKISYKIVAEAKKRADKIIEEAEKRAKAIVAKAKRLAAETKKRKKSKTSAGGKNKSSMPKKKRAKKVSRTAKASNVNTSSFSAQL